MFMKSSENRDNFTTWIKKMMSAEKYFLNQLKVEGLPQDYAVIQKCFCKEKERKRH